MAGREPALLAAAGARAWVPAQSCRSSRMKHVFNTSVGRIEANVDRGSRTITIYRFDDQGEPIAGAIENWDRVDLLDVLSRHIGVPLSEASRIARELREQDMSLGSL